MGINSKNKNQNRRDFLKTTFLVGSAFFVFPRELVSSTHPITKKTTVDFDYKYKTVSVEHVREIKLWMDKLKKDGKLSTNETYHSY